MRIKIYFVECKAIAHLLHATEATVPSIRGQSIWRRCENCGMIRMDVLNADGTLFKRNYYNYPEGYKDSPRLTKAEYRLEYLAQQRQARINRKVKGVA